MSNRIDIYIGIYDFYGMVYKGRGRMSRTFYPDQFTEDWMNTMQEMGQRGIVSKKICEYIFEGVKRDLWDITYGKVEEE